MGQSVTLLSNHRKEKSVSGLFVRSTYLAGMDGKRQQGSQIGLATDGRAVDGKTCHPHGMPDWRNNCQVHGWTYMHKHANDHETQNEVRVIQTLKRETVSKQANGRKWTTTEHQN